MALDIKEGRILSISDLNALASQPDDQEILAKQKDKICDDKFHLPTLFINDATQWDSQPKENRRHLTDEVATDLCLGNCCGYKGLKAGCCKIDPNDLEHVLGPLDEEWIREIRKWLNSRGLCVTREDIVIDFEEGRLIGNTMFNGHPVFQQKTSYPILRMQILGPRYACKFLSPETGKCSIYLKRPKMCRDYYCEFIKAGYLIRTPDHPNTYSKLR